MSITKELERLHDDHIEDIADGAGYYTGTNPPRKLNIAYAISRGLTTNIAKACDIFYGNEPVSQTISEAIAKGVEAGSPYKSIADILKAVESDEDVKTIVLFDGTVTTSSGYHNATLNDMVNLDAYPDYMIVTFDGSKYTLPSTGVTFRENLYYGTFSAKTGPAFDAYPCCIEYSSSFSQIYTAEDGTYSVKIEVKA